MELLLQIWGAGFYLSNKALFTVAETQPAHRKKFLKMAAWIIYILGVPAWVIILIGEHNWIAASIEAGGIPAMLLGLYNTYHDNNKHHKLSNLIVYLTTYSAIAFGVTYSLIINNGIHNFSQILEMGVMLGFLLGSYYMAKHSLKGWLFFMLMNTSMAILMILQEKPILFIQQFISLSIVAYGYYRAKKSPVI